MPLQSTLRRLALFLALGLSIPSSLWASLASDGDAVVRQARKNKVEFNAPLRVTCEWKSDHVPATVGAVNGALRKHGFVFSVAMVKPNATAKPSHVLSARKIGIFSEKDLSTLVQEVESQSGSIGSFSWSVAQQ
jgi:hypothetical protein